MTRHVERRGRSLDAFKPAVAHARNGRVGLLTLGSFYEGLLPKGSPGFAAEFSRAFDAIAQDKPERLLIDLRSNEGGNNDVVPMLYAHLTDKPFYFTRPTILKSDTISGLKYMDSPGEDLRTFAVNPRRFVDRDPTYGWVLRPDADEPKSYAPSSKPYLGPLTVLTDGGSFSATGGLLDLLHRFHRRVGREVAFLGEAPGVDTQLGWGSGGQGLNVKLPNSQLRLSIPLLGSPYHFATSQTPVRLPDRMLEPLASELVDDADGVLNRATDLSIS
jgi:hypothetical protein